MMYWKMQARFYLLVVLGGVTASCDRSSTQVNCDSILGVCPEYQEVVFEQNGVFETVVPAKYHGSGHSIDIDDMGNILVGGYRMERYISDVDEYPTPTLLTFSADGELLDSTYYFSNTTNWMYGVVAGVSSHERSVFMSMWTLQYNWDDRQFDPWKIRYFRQAPAADSLEELFHSIGVGRIDFYPGLTSYLGRPGRLLPRGPLSISDADGNTLLMTLGITEDGHHLYKVSPNGALRWAYTMADVDRVFAVTELAENGFVAAGAMDSALQYGLVRLDNEGMPIWQLNSTDIGMRYRPRAVASSDDAIYVMGVDQRAGRLVIIRHALDGTFEWMTEVTDNLAQFDPAEGSIYETADLVVTESGKLVLTWASDDADNKSYLTELTVLSAEGAIEKRIPVSPSYERVHILAMIEQMPGRVVLTGSVGRYDGYLNEQNFLLVAYDV